MKYFQKIVNCKKVINETVYNDGKQFYTIDFVYDVQYKIFGKIFMKHYVKTDCIRFATLEQAKKYISLVCKESGTKLVFLNGQGYYLTAVHPNNMDIIKKYYTSYYDGFICKEKTDPEIVYIDGKFNLVANQLYSASDKELDVLLKRLIDQKEHVTKPVEVIKEDYAELPTDEKLKKLEMERNEVIEAELQRIKKYETFLESLIK